YRTELRGFARSTRNVFGSPDPQRGMGHGEVLAQVQIEHGQEALQVGRGKQREAQAVHLLADRVVLLADLQEFGEARLQGFAFLAQEIGRASCRERVEVWGGDGSFRTKERTEIVKQCMRK